MLELLMFVPLFMCPSKMVDSIVIAAHITTMPTNYRKVLQDTPQVMSNALLGSPSDRIVARMKDLQNLHVCRLYFNTGSYN
jgi:hypothetical protein